MNCLAAGSCLTNPESFRAGRRVGANPSPRLINAGPVPAAALGPCRRCPKPTLRTLSAGLAKHASLSLPTQSARESTTSWPFKPRFAESLPSGWPAIRELGIFSQPPAVGEDLSGRLQTTGDSSVLTYEKSNSRSSVPEIWISAFVVGCYLNYALRGATEEGCAARDHWATPENMG